MIIFIHLYYCMCKCFSDYYVQEVALGTVEMESGVRCLY